MSDNRQDAVTFSAVHKSINALPTEVRGAAKKAWWVLFWQNLWPRSAFLLGFVCLFAASALFGLWFGLPNLVRGLALGISAVIALVLVTPVIRTPFPSLREVLAVLDEKTGVKHRPVTSFIDDLPPTFNKPDAAGLWQLHKQKMAALMENLAVGLPRSDFIKKDPWGIRVIVGVLLFVSFFWMPQSISYRLASPFIFGTEINSQVAKIDAWIDPPAYTAKPPLFLTQKGGDKDETQLSQPLEYAVPIGSKLVVRLQNVSDPVLKVHNKQRDDSSSDIEEAIEDGIVEYTYQFKQSATVDVTEYGGELASWTFNVIEDQAPQISFALVETVQNTGSLKLGYDLSDDYGIVRAEAEIEQNISDENNYSETLIAAPEVSLVLPSLPTKQGSGQTYKNLTDHPWAGSQVKITLLAYDAIDQEGYSQTIEFELPQRRFTNPIAKAVVEQRRILATKLDSRLDVARAIDAITISPEGFIDSTTAYLGLRSAYSRLIHNDDTESMISVVEQLWSVALQLEDGDLSISEEALRAAQEALQKALSENATDEEIRRLMDELRQALDRYLSSLQNQTLQNGNLDSQQLNSDQLIERDELSRMLDAIENLANQGSRDQAQQMLSDLQDLLENLQRGQAQGQTQQQQQMSEAIQELGEMLQRQRELMDQTYQMQRDAQNDQNSNGQPHPEAAERLKLEQGELREALEELLRKMEEQGLNANSLEEAERNMGRATDALGQGDTGQALSDQGDAMRNLQDGARSLAEQLNQSLRNSQGPAAMQGRDPAGRNLPTREVDPNARVKIPDEIETQRARTILRELRRRLGDRYRSLQELDYLQRLLVPF